MKDDGVLTLTERQQLQSILTNLSKDIYQEKHDGEKDFTLKAKMQQRLDNGEMTRAEARVLLKKVRTAYALRRELGNNKDPGDEQRQKLQGDIAAIVGEIYDDPDAPAAEATATAAAAAAAAAAETTPAVAAAPAAEK